MVIVCSSGWLDRTIDSWCSPTKKTTYFAISSSSSRLCERAGDFGPRFIELARSVYRTNDRRADLKRQVNTMLGSRLGDEKQYQAYD
jgi:hypothetical protein